MADATAQPSTVVFPGMGPLAANSPPIPVTEVITLPLHPRKTSDAPGVDDRHAIPGYEILGELGRGGMGVVYLARQVGLKRLVALKMILGGAHAGQADLARFRLEAQAVARLQHPGIVQVYEIGTHEGMPFLSLEYCAGGSLASYLQGTPLPPRQAAELLEAVARAVHAAHQANIIHRDLKPANILLQRKTTTDQTPASAVVGLAGVSSSVLSVVDFIPKITDFGLAKSLQVSGSSVRKGEHGLTQTGAIMGTPSYLAPEQASGIPSKIGRACDIYGLGSILYEALTGRPPFIAATQLDTVLQVLEHEPVPPAIFNHVIDADLERITLKCLEKKPEQRYATAEDLADDLARYLRGEPVKARSINLLERLQRELAHSQHDIHLRPWGTALMLLGLLIFVSHLATSLLLLAHCPRWLSFWGPRSVLLVAVLSLFLRYRPHRLILPTNSIERLIWAVWVGYLLTFISLFWVMQILKHHHLEIYGVVTALSGLAWFTMGGHVWGGCYLIGAAFLLLAPVMALQTGSVWSPFYFGTIWSAALLILGRRYWKLAQKQG
jgi:serine/threonine protein kinase